MLAILGTAKILGAVALVVPKFPRLKKWAYAGFVFDFIGAIWSHLAVQGFGKVAALVLTPLTVVVISYLSYRRLERDGTSVA
jgi:DoxX-like protein